MAKNKDIIGKRMKEYYENSSKTKLLRRVPVAIRIDGKAFHTFTRGFQKPFDEVLMKTMQETMQYLCENIQGCVFGYTQSDEITLILVDYEKLTSDAWFDNEVQKICSVSASMATMAFSKKFVRNYMDWFSKTIEKERIKYNEDKESIIPNYNADLGISKLLVTYSEAEDKGAMFDSRCFNIPKHEVANLIYWRQQDASKNSVQMLGRAYFSNNQLKNKNNSQVQDMLIEEYGVNWNDYPTDCKRGAACIKVPHESIEGRTKWYIDKEMPIIKGSDREYVEKLIYVGE